MMYIKNLHEMTKEETAIYLTNVIKEAIRLNIDENTIICDIMDNKLINPELKEKYMDIVRLSYKNLVENTNEDEIRALIQDIIVYMSKKEDIENTLTRH